MIGTDQKMAGSTMRWSALGSSRFYGVEEPVMSKKGRAVKFKASEDVLAKALARGRKKQMARKRILIVDDEAPFARMVKLSLERNGPYEVHIETAAPKALETARQVKPDMIFVDVAQFQADLELKNTPVAVMTAAVTCAEVASKGGMIGGRRYLAKPVCTMAIIDCIERSLREAGAPPPPLTPSVANYS
jgi:CheY-like chemotaxis protein